MTSKSSWIDRAACVNEDPDLFFPVGTVGPAVCQVEAAKLVCAGCPVRQECLAWAVASGMDEGIWGGHSGDELRAPGRAQRARRTNPSRRNTDRRS